MQKVSEVYEKLYHYTNWDGLIGILQSKTLWATHCNFLNDYSEIVLFRNKLIELLIPHVCEACEELIKQIPSIEQYIKQMGGIDHFVKNETEVIVDKLYEVTDDEIYILSFCGQHSNPQINSNGLLSQWRGYGSGGGFVLVFNTKIFEEMLDIETRKHEYSSMHFCDLVYSNDNKKLEEELSEDLSIIAKAVKILINNISTKNKENMSDIENAYHSFVRCISRYKHYGFNEENEVRVVALPTAITQDLLNLARRDNITFKPEKERKFRNKNGQLVPYIELLNSVEIELPIERIIVGPHKEKEARASALRVMLKKTNIEVTCSDIPFIG